MLLLNLYDISVIDNLISMYLGFFLSFLFHSIFYFRHFIISYWKIIDSLREIQEFLLRQVMMGNFQLCIHIVICASFH